MNCHGCKWLDENYRGPKGKGYCCKVERSRQEPKIKVRTPDMTPCELYEKGDFATRWRDRAGDDQDS